MNIHATTRAVLTLATALMLGCPPSSNPGTTESSSGSSSDSSGSSGGSTSNGSTSGGLSPTTTSASTTTGDPTTAGPTTNVSSTTAGPTSTTDTSGESSTTDPGAGPFEFEDAPFEMYTQIDRTGFPGTNLGLNLLGDRDLYNAATPVDDAALQFITNVNESLDTLHHGVPGMQVADNTGVADDLTAIGFMPCVPPPLPADSCDDQIGPFVIPDVLALDLDDPPDFPNGRRLDAPAMDLVLALWLLDLDVHPITAFLDLDGDNTPGPSLNPLANDVAFSPTFPYLAPAHR